tara:strand:+ start:182 stop:421 length:240 start_codon:yes stop_codon:yes gene_type:complete
VFGCVHGHVSDGEAFRKACPNIFRDAFRCRWATQDYDLRTKCQHLNERITVFKDDSMIEFMQDYCGRLGQIVLVRRVTI